MWATIRMDGAGVLIDLMFLNVMVRLGRSLAGETGQVNRARDGGEPEEHTRSKV